MWWEIGSVKTDHYANNLVEKLPTVRGSYRENFPLSKIAFIKAGGNAEVLYKPADIEDLSYFLANTPEEIPVTILGLCSNLIVRDGGIPGVTVKLGRAFSFADLDGTDIVVGAGVPDVHVSRVAAEAGLTNLEFLSGIPGTVGGAISMNAGAYGFETKDVLVDTTVINRAGEIQTLPVRELGLKYRASSMPAGTIFLSARFRGEWGNKEQIFKRMEEIKENRTSTQPTSRTGGSTFKNPPGYAAWQLIEQAGCRGMKRGDALVSPKHCNFLINTANSTAEDLEELGLEVKFAVLCDSGITLDWEIKRIGCKIQELQSI